MRNKWENSDIADTFRNGEWAVCQKQKFAYTDSSYRYIVWHQCDLCVQGEPWLWGGELHIACPDCHVVCPEDVQTVFEMMK
jgi:hypothetical protein